jgi:hypothetical protein
MDLKKLRLADYVIAGGTVLYLIFAILPWVDFGDYFGLDVPGDSISGFSFSGLVTFSFVLFLLATAWTALPAFTDVKLGFPRSWVTVGLAGLGLLLTLIAWIRSLSFSFQIWPLLALVAAVVITLFAFLALLPELRNRPALPGGPANAAQWANQPAPEFGQQGRSPAHPTPPPAQPGPPQPYGAATPPPGDPAGSPAGDPAAPGGPAAPGHP